MKFPGAVGCAAMLVIASCTTGQVATTDTRVVSSPVDPSAGLETVVPGEALQKGVSYVYRFPIHCGMKYVPDLNGTNWATDQPLYGGTGQWPSGFKEYFVDPQEAISPVLRTHLTLISGQELQLTLPDGTRPSVYHPTEDEVPPCA